MARGGKGDENEPSLSADDRRVRDEIVRQLKERRGLRPRALYEARKVEQESRARRIAVTAIDAHPTVKLALLMADRLRFLALRVDAVLTRNGDPTGTTEQLISVTIAPLLRELGDLCAPFSGSPERQRDRLIDLVEWGASLYESSPRDEDSWAHALSTLRFELRGAFPELGDKLSPTDLALAVAVFVQAGSRPKGIGALLPKWKQLRQLIERAGMGVVAAETIRTEYTRRRSSERKRAESERKARMEAPLRRITDDPNMTEATRERIRQIEAKALRRLRRPDDKS